MTLLVAVAKCPDKNSLEKEGVVLVHSSSVQPIGVGKSRRKSQRRSERQQTKSTFSVVRKQKRTGAQW